MQEKAEHCLPGPVVSLADGGSFSVVEVALFSGRSEVLLGSNTSG